MSLDTGYHSYGTSAGTAQYGVSAWASVTLPGRLNLGCRLLSFQTRQKRPHKYKRRRPSLGTFQYTEVKEGLPASVVPLLNMEWSRLWAVSRTDQGWRVRTWRYLVL